MMRMSIYLGDGRKDLVVCLRTGWAFDLKVILQHGLVERGIRGAPARGRLPTRNALETEPGLRNCPSAEALTVEG